MSPSFATSLFWRFDGEALTNPRFRQKTYALIIVEDLRASEYATTVDSFVLRSIRSVYGVVAFQCVEHWKY